MSDTNSRRIQHLRDWIKERYGKVILWRTASNLLKSIFAIGPDCYLVIYSIPYEGSFTETFTTLEQVREFIKRKVRDVGSYDDFTVTPVIAFPAEHSDVYTIMQGVQ